MPNRRCLRLSFAAAMLAAVCIPWPLLARAHGTRAGDLVIEHPYAVPSVPGAADTSAHLRALRNTGSQADRLLAAHTPASRRVELRRRGAGSEALDAIELPPGGAADLRHDGAYELRLIGLQRPLRDGDRFALTLRFARAGEREVTVWVQTPRDRSRP